MTYSDKREFAARVFTAVLNGAYNRPAVTKDMLLIRLLAQAQLDALPEYDGWEVEWQKWDAAYALAVKLAPLVGVEVNLG